MINENHTENNVKWIIINENNIEIIIIINENYWK